MFIGDPQRALDQAVALYNERQFGQAAEICRRLAASFSHPGPLHLLGAIALNEHRTDEAITLFRRAVQAAPDVAIFRNSLGAALVVRGQYQEAITHLKQVLQLRPELAEAHLNLGLAFQRLGQLADAASEFQHAIAHEPAGAESRAYLADVNGRMGKLDEAALAAEAALRLKPDLDDAHVVIGGVRKDQGLLDEALAHFRRAAEINPGGAGWHNFCYTMHFSPQYDAAEILAEHRRWNDHQRQRYPRTSWTSSDRDCTPDRKLRVGYLSPDFTEHPIGRFLLPLVENHDRNVIDAVLFSEVRVATDYTARFKAAATAWHDVDGQTDEQVAALIRRERIDILVDLTMHMNRNRLLVFVQKPAPVQVTYLAYCSTTGLDAIDYRLSDPYIDPPSANDGDYSETTLRLPQTYWCYRPLLDEVPNPGPTPAATTGRVTFGCLNNPGKVTPEVLKTWCQILRGSDQSDLVLHVREGSHVQQRLIPQFAREGIDPERLRFVGLLGWPQFMGLHQWIDICLDPFPYNGGTTTCDALWMGVPVVSLVGRTGVGRAGLSLLSNVGLPELAAHSKEQYVAIALGLARDLPRLAGMRRTLRQRMLASPLSDAPRFARDMQSAFRQMWQRWCSRAGHSS